MASCLWTDVVSYILWDRLRPLVFPPGHFVLQVFYLFCKMSPSNVCPRLKHRRGFRNVSRRIRHANASS